MRFRICVATAGLCCGVALLAACEKTRVSASVLAPLPSTEVTSTDGVSPDGVIEGSDGNFYGTTQNGGQYNLGVVFKLTSEGTEVVLHSFAGGPKDGADPQGVIQGSDGNLYGTTADGGNGGCVRPEPVSGNGLPAGCGTVFKITTAGVESVLYFFTGADDGGIPSPGLVQTSNGDLYGTASVGGGRGNGVVFQLTLTGLETVLHSFTGAPSDGAEPASLILGSDGSFYGVTTYGGESQSGTAFRVTLDGVESLLHSFTGGHDGANPSAPLAEGTDGNFYGTTPLGGASANPSSQCLAQGCGTVFKITPAGDETIVYAFEGGSAHGANPYAGLILGTDGNFYGTTESGGNAGCSGGCGTAFSITPAGVASVLHFFGGTSLDGMAPSTGLIQAANGSFYGTTPIGGQFHSGTFFTMTPAGVETVLFSFGGSAPP